MALQSKIVLKNSLSAETLDLVKSYLSHFLPRRHSFEHFGETFSICLRDSDDLRLVRGQFPSLIATVQTLR